MRSEHAALAERTLEAPHVGHQFAPFTGAVHGQQQPVAVEGLGQVIVRSRAHGSDCGLELALGGDNDDRQVGVARPQVLDHLEAADLTEAEVDAGDRRVLGLLAQRALPRIVLDHTVAGALEPEPHQPPGGGIVVNDRHQGPSSELSRRGGGSFVIHHRRFVFHHTPPNGRLVSPL